MRGWGQRSGGWKVLLKLALLALAASPELLSQAAGSRPANPASSLPLAAGVESSASAYAAAQAIREIDDPHTGGRWLLLRDAGHPGGPGRLVLVGGLRNAAWEKERAGAPSGATPAHDRLPPGPVIRAGDLLVVEETTAVVEARLEAVALAPAAIGSQLEVRLRIGGRVVKAVALAPGRAAFVPETEARL